MARQLDAVGWYICTLHQLVGHNKAAAVIGEDPGDARLCVLCRYEQGRATHTEVIEAVGVDA